MVAPSSESLVRFFRNRLARQLTAVIAVLLALLLRVTLERLSLTLPTYITFYPVVFLVAMLSGIWEGILATTLSALVADYFLLPPVGQFAIHSTSDTVGLAIFSIFGVSISVVAELYRRRLEKQEAFKIEAAILNERETVEESLERAETSLSERLRFLEALETLRTEKNSGAMSAAVPISRNTSAENRKSGFPGLDQKGFRSFLRRTVVFPFVAALILAGTALWAAFDLYASMQWVDHTDQVIGQSRCLLRLLVDMETGERGYLVTGNDAFLQPYQEASNEIDSEFQGLLHLVADNPAQQARLETLRKSIHHWHGYAEQMIALRSTGGAYTDLTMNLAGKGEVDEIREQIAGFQSVEEHLRDERHRTANRDWRLVITICIVFGLCIGSGLSVFTFRRMKVIAASFEEASRALEESERRWATTLTSIGDAVLATDSEGRVTFLNPSAVALTGWQSEEAMGQPVQNVFQIINEKTQGPAEDPVSRVLKDGRTVLLANHTALVHKDGQKIPIADSAAPILDSDGKTTGVVLVFHDVTEHRRAEGILETTLQRFYAILSNLYSGILLVTDEGRIEFANPAFCRMFDLKESPTELMANFDSEKVIAKIDTAYENPKEAVLRVREIVKQGQSVLSEEILMQSGAMFLRDYVPLILDGKLYGRMWVHTDITELKSGEEALRESRAKLAAALAAMTDSVIITDAQGRFVEFNDAYAKFYRFKSKAECARNFAEFASLFDVFLPSGEPAPREMWAIQRALRGESATSVEYALQRKDTGEAWIGSLSFSPIRDKDGAIIGAVVTSRDITEEKQAQEARQIAIDFLGMVNQSRGTRDLLQRAATFFQERSGCEAVGIRLRDGDDYPYFEARGFSRDFVQLETRLCVRTASGMVQRDRTGKAMLECLCGNVIRGQVETSKPFYTSHGSFWSNSTTDLMANATKGDLPSTTRNRCNRAGYESVALFPIYVGDERFGLLQLNDRRKGRFSAETIFLWERLAGHLATAISKFQAEEALRNSQQQLQAIIDGAPDTVVFLKDIDGRFITVNSRFEEMLGIARDDVRGKTDYDILTKERADHYRAHDQQVLTTGQPMLIEELTLLADGKEHTFLASKFPLVDASGRPYAVCAISSDITERKRMEEALQESEKRYRNLFNTMNEGFCIIEVLFDAKGEPEDYRFLEVNDAFEKQTGLDNVVGKRMRELVPAHETHWFETYGKVALTGEAAHFMNEAKVLNRVYDVHAYRVGKPEQRRVAIVFNDFSDYKRAEEAIRASEAQFRNLANAIPQLCWTANADGWLSWYNERWYEYTGTTPEQMEGWGWQSVHDPVALPQVMERWKTSIATGSQFEMVFPIRGADGVFRPFLTRVMPVKDANGVVARWFGTNTDISEQKQIEAELRKNQERLSVALEVAQLGEWERNLKTHAASRSLRHAQIFGYSSIEQEWNFEKFLSHVLPQHRAEVAEWFKASRQGGSWDFETQIRRADGEVRWVWFRSHTRLDEDGQPEHAYGIVQDITERKQAEEELKKLNRTLKALSNSNLAILHATDEPAYLKDVCRIVTRDCGHAMVWIGVAEDDEDKTVRPVAFSGFDEGYLKALNVTWGDNEHGRGPTGIAIRTGQPSICRNMLTDPKFAPWRENAIERGYASSVVIPLKEQDKVWGSITIYSREADAFSAAEVELLTQLAGDLEVGIQTLRMRAAHAQAEEALSESEELLSLFVEHAPAALAMFDTQMRYLHASQRWRADYGLGDRELRGVSHYEILSEIPESWREAHRRGLAGEVLHGDADRFERADGSVQWIRWEIRPWHDVEGDIGGLVIFTEDVTERKMAGETLLQSEKMAFQRQQLQALAERLVQVREEERTRVARDLHDQIGQILTAIKLDMTWVVRHLPKSKDDVHGRLASSIELINEGVQSVRKICSGLRPGILDDLGIAAAIEWQTKEFAARTGISCEASLPPDDLHLEGDRATAIFRIFQECLTNILRHAEAKSVRASLFVENEDLMLTVEDNGKGFRESEVLGSLGILGMKERAQACGGSVQISSSPGKGTKVTVCVPMRSATGEREEHEHTDSR